MNHHAGSGLVTPVSAGARRASDRDALPTSSSAVTGPHVVGRLVAADGGAGTLPGEGGGVRWRGPSQPRHASGRPGLARTALPAAAPPAAPAPARVLVSPVAPAGFRVAAPTEALAGTALVRQAVL